MIMNTRIPSKIKNICPQFLVADITLSMEFYTKNLGFETSFMYEDFYCGITKDGCSIHLKSAEPVLEERENRRNNEHADIILSVEKIDDLYDDIKNRSVEIIQPLRDMPYGREFYICDPDGYVLAFLEQ